MPSSTLLTIREVRARGLNLQAAHAMETANGAMNTTPLVLVDILTEQGITGVSYVRCYTPLALEPLTRLIANLDAVIKGDSATPLLVAHKLQRHFRLAGSQGLTGMALAAIDMALWDALAKACGVPLVTLLGGTPEPIPAYASLRSMSPQGASSEAEALLARGFTALKLKVGRGELRADLEAIRAVRSVAGASVKLMVDYNQSLSVAAALARVRALDEEDLYWIEEPTRADDYAGHARIARAAQTPIQLGENCWGAHDVARLIAAEAADHIMLDVMKVGGVSGWLQAGALAAAASLPVSSHAFPEFSVHLLGVTPTCQWLEYLDHVGGILVEPIQIEGGYALTPEGAGSGMAWDEDAIAHALAQ